LLELEVAPESVSDFDAPEAPDLPGRHGFDPPERDPLEALPGEDEPESNQIVLIQGGYAVSYRSLALVAGEPCVVKGPGFRLRSTGTR
jgi:hypothetical protein